MKFDLLISLVVCFQRRGFLDPYIVLGIDPDSSEIEVKKAYRMLALKYHPDRCPKELRHSYEEKFKEITAAYKKITENKDNAFSKKESINIVLEEVEAKDKIRNWFDNNLPVLGVCLKIGFWTALIFIVAVRALLILAEYYSYFYSIIDICFWSVPVLIFMYLYLVLRRNYNLIPILLFALLTSSIFIGIIEFFVNLRP